MNTLSAKADGFFEHPAYWQGWAQLARSRPGALKNVERRVLIPVHHKSAFASMNAVIGNLVLVFSAQVSDSSVQSVDPSTLLSPVASTMLEAQPISCEPNTGAVAREKD